MKKFLLTCFRRGPILSSAFHWTQSMLKAVLFEKDYRFSCEDRFHPPIRFTNKFLPAFLVFLDPLDVHLILKSPFPVLTLFQINFVGSIVKLFPVGVKKCNQNSSASSLPSDSRETCFCNNLIRKKQSFNGKQTFPALKFVYNQKIPY